MIKWPEGEDFPWINGRPMYNDKTWFELSDEEHQRYPGDYEAQVSHCDITFHSEEHLASSDKGVTLFRRKFRQAISDVADGKDPEGIRRGDDLLVHVRTRNFVIPADA